MSGTGEDQRTVEAEAAAWTVRLDAGPLDEAEQHAFEAWLRRSDMHAESFLFGRTTWEKLGRLRDLPHGAVAASPARDSRRRLAVSRRHLWQGLAASLLAGTGLAAYHATDPVTALRADHRTAVGETRIVTLPDGSILRLNTDSAVALRFDADHREVELLRGEAAFTVARIAEGDRRPFVVRAAGGMIMALGTRFMVRVAEAAVDVTVIEHAVEVSLDGEVAASDAVILRASEAVRYDTASGISEVRRLDPERAAAWLRRRLVFDQVPLARAVAELNRYRNGRIVILDSALAGRRVSGVFRLDDLDGAVRLIAAELGARTIAIPPVLTALY